MVAVREYQLSRGVLVTAGGVSRDLEQPTPETSQQTERVLGGPSNVLQLRTPPSHTDRKQGLHEAKCSERPHWKCHLQRKYYNALVPLASHVEFIIYHTNSVLFV